MESERKNKRKTDGITPKKEVKVKKVKKVNDEDVQKSKRGSNEQIDLEQETGRSSKKKKIQVKPSEVSEAGIVALISEKSPNVSSSNSYDDFKIVKINDSREHTIEKKNIDPLKVSKLKRESGIKAITPLKNSSIDQSTVMSIEKVVHKQVSIVESVVLKSDNSISDIPLQKKKTTKKTFSIRGISESFFIIAFFLGVLVFLIDPEFKSCSPNVSKCFSGKEFTDSISFSRVTAFIKDIKNEVKNFRKENIDVKSPNNTYNAMKESEVVKAKEEDGVIPPPRRLLASFRRLIIYGNEAESLVNLKEILTQIDPSMRKQFITTADENGWQPIHEAVRAGKDSFVKFLISEGADVFAKTNAGINSISLAKNFLPEDHPVVQHLEEVKSKQIE
jgi:hypothetical protein